MNMIPISAFIGLFIYIQSVVISCQDLKNVLLIIVDDLRPEIGPYLDTDRSLYPLMQTPHINQLAEDSIVFMKAYTQAPICGPSRNSMLTGRRPDTTKAYINNEMWRNTGGNFTSLPQYFKENGYVTYASGKIYHGDSDNDYSWTTNNYKPNTGQYWHADGLSWGIAEPIDYNNISLPDMQVRDYVLNKLEEVSSKDDPFFIAVGFQRPHLPLLAPRMFFDLYPEVNISLPEHPYVPVNHDNVAWSYWNDLPSYNDIKEFDNSYNKTLPDYKTLELRRAYYASVSYSDALIGEVLDQLEVLDLQDNTIVMLVSDHGWQMGEHGEWAKNTNFELDLRVPMMIKVPGETEGGKTSDALVELVDIFPTLVELAGLKPLYHCPEDSSHVLVCHEGQSMVDLITQPNMDWKTATFSQLLYSGKEKRPMGHTVMTPQYRYVRWMHFYNDTLNWNEPIHEELFDLINDPDQLINVAGYPEFTVVQEMMFEKLLLGWRMALPA